MDFAKIKSNLENRGFIVSCFETAKAASEYLDSQIDGKSVGFGGSVTLDQMGVLKMLETHNKVLYRFDDPDGKSPVDIMKEALTADVFLTSANGIAETGEIINIDGNCNRVAGVSSTDTKRCFSLSVKTRSRPTMTRRFGALATLPHPRMHNACIKTRRAP